MGFETERRFRERRWTDGQRTEKVEVVLIRLEKQRTWSTWKEIFTWG